MTCRCGEPATIGDEAERTDAATHRQWQARNAIRVSLKESATWQGHEFADQTAIRVVEALVTQGLLSAICRCGQLPKRQHRRGVGCGMTYTLDEARRELQLQECRAHGHDWDVISTMAGPIAISCANCGERRAVEH